MKKSLMEGKDSVKMGVILLKYFTKFCPYFSTTMLSDDLLDQLCHAFGLVIDYFPNLSLFVIRFLSRITIC